MTDRNYQKKNEQLGMNAGTAKHRLLRSILWSLIVETNKNICCKCGQPMCRDTYSIEHLVPWLDSENPFELFFDLNNISYSHLKCNVAAARKTHKWEDRAAYDEHFKAKDAERQRKSYTAEKRRIKYEREKKKKSNMGCC